jgi:hypothetical protein
MSKKIGRNDPCPCGSGKKYKHCHLKEQSSVAGMAVSTQKAAPMTFDDLLIVYNSVQILGLLGALQLHPANHGRNFRFEQLCLATLRQFNQDDERPSARWERLKGVIENYTYGAEMEDPLSNAFTEIAIFEEGNYIVYSGIYDGFTEILNHLTECIFLHRHDLNKDFIKTVRDAIGLLLFMSNSVARDAGHLPFIFQQGGSPNIEFPEYGKAAQYMDAIYFPKAYLKEVCDNARYDINILSDFLLQPGSKELDEEDSDKNVVNFKPLVEVKDDILLYMPTGIPNALISYVYQKAKDYNCYDELMELLYERQFHLSCVALAKTGWLATTIELPAPKANLSIKETVLQFDNQKLAYVCYLKTGQPKSEDGVKVPAVEIINPFEERTNEIVQYLSTINAKQPFAIFCLYIIGETANDYYLMWRKPSAGNQSLALKYKELWTITHSSKVNSLTLWKFAKCYSRTNELTRIMAMGGVMDAYAIYRKNHGSLLDSDEVNPMGGMLMIVNGSSDEFRREVQKQQNEHAVPIFHEGKLAYAKVTQFKDYAPIYMEKEISEYFRIVIENFKMPVWITSPQTKAGKESLATYACEAVAFWFNKMESLLASYLNEQRLIQFEVEIIVAKELMKAEQFEIKDVDVNEIKLGVEIITPRIRVSMPFDYLCAVMLPDNRADKMLMRSVLQGIVDYIIASGKSTALNADIINRIVEQTLQPAGAKMLMFSDASANIRMDSRNLPSMRYISDTDVSYILDNLVSYLPKSYAIADDIPDKKDKIKLCDDIVNALIEQITSRLAEFDGVDLLKWLIKLNEKCIQLRDFREILIPAKIACFSDFQTEVDELMDGERNLVTTAHAIRTLIEFIATKIPTGQKWPNFDDIDELLALTNQLTEWGALSEAMRMDIDNPQMGLLPSGRIGTDKTVEREAYKPYAIAKTESTVFRNIEDFESNYVPARKTSEAVETEESKSLDIAFKSEFDINLTMLAKIIGTLVNEGFTSAESCMEMEESALESLLAKIEGITAGDIDTALKLLTLLERKGIGVPPDGYTPIEIFPWRYNRSISYIRRPLIKVTDKETAYYYFGYRHLMQFIDNLFYLLDSSKLPGAKSEEMKSWLAAASGDKGNPFREAVKKWFQQNSGYEIIPHEVQIDKDAPRGHIQADKHYGDIDLLVIDHELHIIYSIECKNIHGGRNVHEMKVEMDDYLGRDGKDKKAKMRKHVERNKWLNANKAALKDLVPDAENYTIKSFILTADEIPLAYLKRDDLPLPVKSFTFLRKNGLSYLLDM